MLSSRSYSGVSHQQARPTQLLSVERSSVTPWRASICDWRYSGRLSQNLLTSTCATSASVAMPPSIGRSGAGADHDSAFAGPAGVARTARDTDPQLRGHDVQLLAAQFADRVHRAAAAGAVAVFDVDQHLIARQMRRQGAVVAVGACLAPLALVRSPPRPARPRSRRRFAPGPPVRTATGPRSTVPSDGRTAGATDA